MVKRLVLLLLGAAIALPCLAQDSVYVVMKKDNTIAKYFARSVTFNDSTVFIGAVAIDPDSIRQMTFGHPPVSARNPFHTADRTGLLHGSVSAGPSRLVTVSLNLPSAATLDLAIFDSFGRRVAQLAHGTTAAGSLRYLWNATSQHGNRVCTGVFMVRGSANGRTIINQTVVVK